MIAVRHVVAEIDDRPPVVVPMQPLLVQPLLGTQIGGTLFRAGPCQMASTAPIVIANHLTQDLLTTQ